MVSFFIGIVIYFVSGIIVMFFSEKFKIAILSLLCFIASIFCLNPAIKTLYTGNSVSKVLNFNNIFGSVSFSIDTLSAFFIIVIAVMTLASVIFSKGYLAQYLKLGKNINSHLIFLTMLIASMLLVVTCQNVFVFLICWEIMSLSSFFLVIFENEEKNVLKVGIKYLVFMHISVLFIMMAFALISIHSGNFDFNSFKNVLQNNSYLANVVFCLAFFGFGTKAGFVPFHNWLPDAHPAAPSHVSAIMSGVMIKTGIYGILRVLTWIVTPSLLISYSVLVISIISGLYGVLYAISQHDLKRLLAYHSIENIGIIGIGIGVGMLGLAYNIPIIAVLGFAGGILHILNHSIFKELLFLSAGSVYVETHTRNVEELGGLIKSMPKTALLFLIGSIAICGLPPFNGFVSEFLIYFGMFKCLSAHHFLFITLMLFAIAGLALIGTMAILCFTKAFSVIFLGMPRSDFAEKVKSDNENSMILPMSFLALLTLVIGIFPQYVFNFIIKIVNVFTAVNPVLYSEPIELMQFISIYAISFILIVFALVVLKEFVCKKKVAFFETWGCGYNRANNKMQYTASSYASPFLSMLKPLFKKVFDIEKPKKLFPKNAHFSLHVDDIEEAYLIKPLVKYDEWFLSKFEALQSGNIQSYIKYGLGFLIIAIIGSLLIG
ncbi:MAG: proton-conducting transporter membrane subunit [Candidatus Gastranaerophilaceae bacterium]